MVVCSSAHDKLVNEVPTELANTIEATKCDPSGDNYSIEIIADQGRSATDEMDRVHELAGLQHSS